MSLRRRISFLLLVIILVIQGGIFYSLGTAFRMEKDFHLLHQGSIPVMHTTLELEGALREAVSAYDEFHLIMSLQVGGATRDDAFLAVVRESLDQEALESKVAWKEVDRLLDRWDILVRERFPEEVGEVTEVRRRVEQLRLTAASSPDQNSITSTLQRVSALEKEQVELKEEMRKIIAREWAEVEARSSRHDIDLLTSGYIVGLGGVLIFVGAFYFWHRLRRLVLDPLNQLGKAMEAFAEGDDKAPLPEQALGEIAILTAVFQDMRTRWQYRKLAQDQSLSQLEKGVLQKESMLMDEIGYRREAEKGLSLFKATVDQAVDGMFWIADEKGFHYLNEAAHAMLEGEVPEDELQWVSLLTRADSAATLAETREKVRVSGQVVREITRSGQEGEMRSLEVRLTVHGFEGVEYLVGVVRDVTAQKKIEQELSWAEAMFQNAMEGIILTDEKGVILRVNPAMVALTGYSDGELVGNRPSIYKSGRHTRAFYQELWNSILTLGHWRNEIWNRHKSGRVFPARVGIRAIVRPEGGVHFVGVMSDITAQKEQESRLDHLANHDILTGLANRHQFNAVFEQSIKHARRVGGKIALMMFDLDRFKVVNDSLGHPAGDSLLQQVGERVQQCLRESDMVARLGGDEFAIILDNQHERRDTVGVAEKVVEVLAAPFQIAGQEVRVSCSMGVALYPNNATQIEDLIRQADAASYFAKQQGGNRFFLFSSDMERDLRSRLGMEQRLLKALEEERFEVYYQPQVNPQTKGLGGVEALIRLREEEGGPLLLPAVFLPVAEESGLIVPIGEWVLRTSCRQVGEWLRQGVDLPKLSVNVSGRQFVRPDFAATVRQILDETAFPPDRLELELTESFLLRNLDSTRETMNRLRAMGVGMVLDDFGSDYSFFSYLRQLPFSGIKLPREYAAQCTRTPFGASLCWSVLTLAEQLGMHVVVEGLEEEEDVSFFRGLSVELIQGFFFAHPMSGEQLGGMLMQEAMREGGEGTPMFPVQVKE